MPAKSLVLVRDNKELWVGCGNVVVVVDTSSLMILDDIPVYKTPRTHVRIMVTDGARVWSADRRSTKILQWDVESRHLTHIFDCDVENPVGEVVSQEVKEARKRRAISDVPGDAEPSYTESMLKGAMGREKGQDDSLPRDVTRETQQVLEGNGGNGSTHVHTTMTDENDSRTKRTPPVTIPGAEAPFFGDLAASKSALPNRRSRSAETDDSGISFTTSTSSATNESDLNTEASNRNMPTTGSVFSEVLQNSRDSKDGLAMVSEEFSLLNQYKGTASEVVSTFAEETTVFQESSSPNSQPDCQMSTTRSEEIQATTDDIGTVRRNSSEREIANQGKGSGETSTTDDGGQLDAASESTNTDITTREFQVVDREETRQAFIEGRTKTTGTSSEKEKEPASMLSLQMSFKPTSRPPSLMSTKKRKSQRGGGSHSPLPKPWVARPRLRVLGGSINRVTALLLVDGSLWIGRGVGDVITVNVSTDSKDIPLGHVFAKLESDNLLGYVNGQVDEIVHSGSNKVVCLRRLEVSRRRASGEKKRTATEGRTPSGNVEDRFTERYQLTVWESWGNLEFRKFKDQLDKFNSLVD